MFTLTDLDLSQLVATQSDTTGLKLTIRRKEVTSTRSSIDLQGPRLQNPDNTLGHSAVSGTPQMFVYKNITRLRRYHSGPIKRLDCVQLLRPNQIRAFQSPKPTWILDALQLPAALATI